MHGKQTYHAYKNWYYQIDKKTLEGKTAFYQFLYGSHTDDLPNGEATLTWKRLYNKPLNCGENLSQREISKE